MLAPWITRADLPQPLIELPGGDPAWDDVCALASSALFAFSGRRWAGHAARTIQVFASRSPWWWQQGQLLGLPWDTTWGACLWGGPVAFPLMVGGELFNHSGCDRPPSIRLPDFPVRQVTAVRIAGQTRDPDSYRLIGNRFLEDSWDGWPTCGLDDRGVMEVDYDYGADPPAAGKAAAIRLAGELGKARAGLPTALPGYIAQRVRQGTSETFARPDMPFDKGRTGIADVDFWLATVNPARLARRARSWSPDTDPRYTTTANGGTP